ncbi:MAG: hypothetical protein R2797_05295 [Gelidibacter sp.]
MMKTAGAISSTSMNKVAKITLLFWVMKIIATTLGETLGDLLAHTWHLGYTMGILLTGVCFIFVLLLQLNAKWYVPALYWLVIVGTTTFGTELSDFMDRTLRLGYLAGSLILITLLVNTFWLWKNSQGAIVVYPITRRKTELFYWLAILISNSLGTAFGDYLSDSAGLGYVQSALITAGVIVLVVALHYIKGINQLVLFWIAFVFTRPFGATFGDLLTKTKAEGGLDLGTLPATLVCIALLAMMVLYSHQTKKGLKTS